MHAGTLVTHAPTTVAAVVEQELRTAIDALDRLRERWLPKLATAASQHDILPPIAVIRARRALQQVDDGVARARRIDPSARTAEVEHLLAVVTSARETLAPVIAVLLDRAHESCARPVQAPDPARQRAVTVEWTPGPSGAATRRHG